MANRQQKEDRRRAIRLMQEEKKKEKLVEKEIQPLDYLDLPAEEPQEVAEKEMGEDVFPLPGPTSWEELEAAKMAMEKAHELREAGWNVQDLVYNIVRHPIMGAKEKASAIQAVGTGFGERVDKIMSDDGEYEEKDLDLLSVQAVIAHDGRKISLVEKALDYIEKKKLTTKVENALSDEQFALVREVDGKKERKYPIHDKAHVRNALARAAQMISAGGDAAADAKAALPKIRAAAKRMGIEVSMEKDRNAILVEKDASGNWRWVGWVSNNFIDWDGDIFSESAHKEYVSWVNENMDVAPVSMSWHTPGTVRENPVDFVTYENGFLIMSGKLTEKEAAAILTVQKSVELGMSHGTFIFGRDPKDPRIVTKYRMYESSDLPTNNAANPFTDFETVTKEAGMDKLQYLAAILGDEKKAKAFLEKTGQKQKDLQDAGIESKGKDEVPTEPVAAVVPEPIAPAVPQDEHIMKMVEKVLKETYKIDDLNAWVSQANEAIEKVPVLEDLVKNLSTATDEKVAELLTPPAASLAWAMKSRASQSDKTVAEPEDEIVKSKPGVPGEYWLSDATGTVPVKQ